MRKIGIVTVAVMVLLLVLAAGCAQPAPAATAPATTISKPSVVVTPAVAPLDADTKIVITGSDYEPGQVIKIMIRDPQVGSLINLATQTEPTPVPNADGCWTTVWTLGRYVSRGVFKEGIYRVWITDEEGDFLASAPLSLADVTKPQEQWPAWAQATFAK